MLATKTNCTGTFAVFASRQMKELAFHWKKNGVSNPGEIPTEAVIAFVPGVSVGIGVNETGVAKIGLVLTDGDTLGDAGDRDTLGDGDGEVVGVAGGASGATNVIDTLAVYDKLAVNGKGGVLRSSAWLMA